MKPRRIRFQVTPEGAQEVEEKPRRPYSIPKRRPRYLPRRMRWPEAHISPDIDLMKFETLGSDFCGCGQRKIDGAVCNRCTGLDFWSDQ
jgi:hypothetical protein